MTLNLLKRAEKGAALSATEHDDNLTAIETEVNAKLEAADPSVTNAREWSAATATQAEAEAGTSTTRLAFTPLRVFQAIAAWWAASSAKTKLDGIANGATANATDAQLRDRATHTGTQAASTIAGLSTVATTGVYADLTGKPTLGTAAAAATGDFATAAQGTKADGALQAASNLSDLASASTARTNLGLGTAATQASTAFATAAQGTDAREWTAATATQAEAEAGTSTTRLAFTPQRVFQAIAAWWAASAFATKLAGIATGATANSTDAQLRDRATHTGTQAASTISMATARLLGRTTAGSGGAEEISIGSNLTLSAGILSATSGGSPGGSDTQVQFNDGGAFAGASGWTWNKTTNTVTLATGAKTANAPALVITQTWNQAATQFFGVDLTFTDTASNFNATPFRIRGGAAGTTLIISVDKSGLLTCQNINLQGGALSNAYQISAISTGLYGFADVQNWRDAANILAQRNGTNAQESRTYGTFTDASNYRRLSKGMSTAGVAFLRPEGAGTGASGNVLHISGLPTSNPGPGILWNDAGTVKVGT